MQDSSVKESIKIGIIGAGSNTCKMHIPNLLAIPGVKILEVANRSPESSKKAADKFNIPQVRDNWEDIASSPDTDAIVIGTWPYLHCEASCLALESGKHVLCEARMAMDEAEARKMLQVSARFPQLTAQVVPAPFTFRVDKTVRNFIADGTLGKLFHFDFNFQSEPLAPSSGKLHWRRNIKYSGKNTMVLGIAYETVLRWLGPAKWVSAVGRVFNNTAIDPESGNRVTVEVPDYLSVQMELVNGMPGTFLISETGQDTYPPYIKIFGEKGTLHFHYAVNGELLFASSIDRKLRPVSIPYEDQGYWRVEEEFINCIRGKEELKLNTFAFGLEYMKFTEAVLRSVESGGQRIPISN